MRSRSGSNADPRPDLARGDRVVVTEQGIRPWTGDVGAIKHSTVSGWWLEIARDDDDGRTWQINARYVASHAFRDSDDDEDESCVYCGAPAEDHLR